MFRSISLQEVFKEEEFGKVIDLFNSTSNLHKFQEKLRELLNDPNIQERLNEKQLDPNYLVYAITAILDKESKNKSDLMKKFGKIQENLAELEKVWSPETIAETSKEFYLISMKEMGLVTEVLRIFREIRNQ